MEKETLKRIFEFLEEKGENRAPFKWKLFNNEPFTKEDLNVEGDLKLFNITSLPEGLKVKGDLDLSYSKIKSLPEGLEVVDNLFLHHSKIKSLPKGLKVWGDIIINKTKLIHYYSNEEIREMIKPGFIKGEIYR
jgi:hypothetical protein